jgi:hypothetical protein
MKKALVRFPLVLTGLLLVLSSCGNAGATSNTSSSTSLSAVPASEATVTVSKLSYEWASYPDDPYSSASKINWVHDGVLTANEPYLFHFSFTCISNYTGDFKTRVCLAKFTAPLDVSFNYLGYLLGKTVFKEEDNGFHYQLSDNTMTISKKFYASDKAYVETVNDFCFLIRPQTTGTIAISLAVSAEYPDVVSVVWKGGDASNNLSLEVA